MDATATWRRKNGFERPFHWCQLLSWVVFGTDALVFCMIVVPLIETAPAKAIVAVSYAASVIVLVYFTALATSCDPSDPHLHREAVSAPGEDDNSELPYCPTCNSDVYPRSKHCKPCNKCVHVFDHHCIWLNNCIGKYNYGWFRITISAAAALTGICLGCCIYLFIDYILNAAAFEVRFQENAWLSTHSSSVAVAFICILIFVNLPLFTLDMQLVLLHSWLRSQDLTTYDYIQNKRQLQLEREENGEVRPSVLQKVKSLPSCMDWIVYQPRKRKQKKDKVDAMQKDPVDEDPAAGQDVEAAPVVGEGPAQAAIAPPACADAMAGQDAALEPSNGGLVPNSTDSKRR
jgi:hypothetical protein